MLTSEASTYRYAKTEAFEAVVLPCNRAYLLAVLPAAGRDLVELGRRLAASPNAVDAALKRQAGTVTMPPFRIRVDAKLRRHLEEMGIRQALSDPRPLTMRIDRELSEQRAFAWMLSLLAAVGFMLAALGLYGLLAQMTIERRREFGIRLALGAAGTDIVRLVARYAVAVASIGILVGLTLSYFGTRAIQSLLFGVSALDPAVYASAVLTLSLVVAVACVGPAWRAVRIQAIEVLRAE